MGIKLDDIKNPYAELGSIELFEKNRDDLNKLTPKEKVILASRIVIGCPKAEWDDFGKRIMELQHNEAILEGSFLQNLSEAYSVRNTLSLINTENPPPCDVLLDEEFQDLFIQFSDVAVHALKDKESFFAERLALTTPENKSKAVIPAVERCFGKAIAEQTRAAFLLHRTTNHYLINSEHPEHFFDAGVNKDFNPDLCNQFPRLFSGLLKGHEEDITKKLVDLNDEKIVSKISRDLETINTAAHDQNNPIRRLAEALAQKAPQQQAKESPRILQQVPVEQKGSPRMFQTVAVAEPKAPVKVATEGAMVSDDEDDAHASSGCCGFTFGGKGK